jgi:TonB family protein
MLNGEVGMTEVHACVDPDGRLTEEPTIAKSSGQAHVDAAALALARAGSGHYLPALVDGHPVPQCFLFRVGMGVRPNSR